MSTNEQQRAGEQMGKARQVQDKQDRPKKQIKIAIARFPYTGSGGSAAEHPSVGEWILRTVLKIKNFANSNSKLASELADCGHEICQNVSLLRYSDTPITMTRNRAVVDAMKKNCDILYMVDADMVPDLYVGVNQFAKPFFDVSLERICNSIIRDDPPCIVFAPYCGPEPSPISPLSESRPYVFRFVASGNHRDNAHIKLEMMTRNEVINRGGLEKVDAGATGLIAIDMRVFKVIPKPWFEYEWTDETRSEKASTEDVYFTRNARLLGCDLFVAWDCWAGHVKPTTVGMPSPIYADHIAEEMRQAILSDIRSDCRIVNVDYLGYENANAKEHKEPELAPGGTAKRRKKARTSKKSSH